MRSGLAALTGQIVGVLPLALALQRVPLGKTLGVMIMIWCVRETCSRADEQGRRLHPHHGRQQLSGACPHGCSADVSQGLVVQRVFLGLIESSVRYAGLCCSALTDSPGFVLLTSRWYTKSELALRSGCAYCAFRRR